MLMAHFARHFVIKFTRPNQERNSSQGNCVAKMHERSNPMKSLKSQLLNMNKIQPNGSQTVTFKSSKELRSRTRRH